MLLTLKAKWHFALFAALLYLAAPLFNAAYDMIEDGRGAYPPNADSVGIDIYSFAIVLLILSPVYAAAVWLATRCYQGGLSLLAFDTRRLLWSSFWSLLLVSLVLVNLYDAACKAKRVLPLEVLNDLAWMYLLLCLRSSLARGKVQQNDNPVPKRELGEDILLR